MPLTQKQTNAWYALRRTLPPWSFKENLKELIEYLPHYGVDELIVKVDTEEFSHGQPPLDWIRKYQPHLFEIKAEMDKLGIVFSINPWITVGHNDRGRDSRTYIPGLRTMVGHDGTECMACACPMSLAWREHVAKIWTMYAETKPHVIWMEDDLRTFFHRPVRYSCFCHLHIERFSDRIGEKVTRETLVEAILKPGDPHPWRSEFLDMQGDVMIELVDFLAKVVHKTSPDTRLGLMSSDVRGHAMEGRRWHDFAHAVADGKPLYSRPPLGHYHEATLRGLYYSHDSIKLTRHMLPKDTIHQTEVENVPFTQYSKSTSFTFLQMAISFAFGADGVTLNLFDHAGTPMECEPMFGKLLKEKKSFFHALAGRSQQSGTYCGVKILVHEKSSYVKKLKRSTNFLELAGDGECLMQMLESHGIPTIYENSHILANSGQQLRAFNDSEIREFLSKGIWLDAVAAKILFDRGFGREIGLKSINSPVFLNDLGAFSAEEFFNPKFGGAEKKFLTLTMPDLTGRPDFSIMEPVAEAEIISRIVDPDAKRHHVCAYAYENQLGGRIIVQAFDLATAYGVAYNHTFRREQLQHMVRWLGRDDVPLLVRGGVYPLGLRKDLGDKTLLGLFNLSLDPWEKVEFEFSDKRTIEKTELLTATGDWVPCKNFSIIKVKDTFQLQLTKSVPYHEPVFLTIFWDKKK